VTRLGWCASQPLSWAQPGQPVHSTNTVLAVSEAANAAEHVWMPNWSSPAVTCGIAGRWSSGMIAGRGGSTVVSDASDK
jgi:hypothetical protein